MNECIHSLVQIVFIITHYVQSTLYIACPPAANGIGRETQQSPGMQQIQTTSCFRIMLYFHSR